MIEDVNGAVGEILPIWATASRVTSRREILRQILPTIGKIGLLEGIEENPSPPAVIGRAEAGFDTQSKQPDPRFAELGPTQQPSPPHAPGTTSASTGQR